MGLRIEQIVARVMDPANPVVWLDPSTSAELWAALPEALKAHAFAVVILAGVSDAATLWEELLSVLGGDDGPVREALSGLPLLEERQQGWAILFQEPGPLRECDEAAFEDLLEAVSQVHEAHWAERRSHLKLVVKD